jgi:putative ABC transport system permease protein
VLLIARAVLRRRWIALVGLGLVAGLAGATVTSAAALARRTGTAYERLEAATAPGDITMFVLAGDEAAERAAELPGVEAAWTADAGVAAIGDSNFYLGFTAGPPPPPGLFRPIAVEGRLPDPDAADEVVIHERFARDLVPADEPVIGARLPLHFLTGDDFRSFDTGFDTPHGPEIAVTVVGVVRIAGQAEGLFSTLAGPGFVPAHPDALIGPVLNIALEDGDAGVPAYLDALDELESEFEPLGAGAEEFSAFDPQVTADARDEVDATAGALVTGLVVFAIVAGLVGLLVVAQAMSRYHAATSTEQRTESALGLTGQQRAGARALAATMGAAVAATVTIVVAIAIGSRGPIGALGDYEPDPGRSVNLAVIALGGAATALAVVGAAGVTAWMAGRSRPKTRRRYGTRTSRLGGKPAALGVRLALGAGTDDAARPARTGLAGLVVGILGIVAALTFSASLTRLIDTPSRYGWSADFAIVDTRPDIDREVLADERVAEATRYQFAPAQVRGHDGFTTLISFEHLRGDAGWWIVDGREPNSADEATIGLELADELDVDVGDTITLELPNRSGSRDVSIVGTGVETPLGNEGFGTTILVAPAGFERFARTEPFSETLVGAEDPSDTAELIDEYGSRYELTEQLRPREVDNLRQLDQLPTILGGFLAIVGFAALANAIVLAVRRRGRDLAVLRVVGYTPSQTAAAVVIMAVVAGTCALVIGVPLGIAAGRTLWQFVAHGASVEGDVLVPAGWTVAVSAGVLLAAASIAVLPARRAATQHPAALLRAE